jgi:hypothetical protein
MDRVEKPEIRFTPQMKELKRLAEKDPRLAVAWKSLFGTPVRTGKGGSSAEISSNGIWTTADPNEASGEIGKRSVDFIVQEATRFIKTWQEAVSPPSR